MLIDKKSIELGITEDIANYLVAKTKHKNAKISKVNIHYKNGKIICLKVELDPIDRKCITIGSKSIGGLRKEITIHTTSEKILKIKRDLLINDIFTIQ